MRRIKPYIAVLLSALVIVLIWWLAVAGPVTVYRTIYYNFSGIDDYRIFPQRKLTPAPLTFRFREGAGPEYSSLKISFGGRKDIELIDLLEKSQTTAFLVVKDGQIVFEKYYHGYDRTTPSLSFSMSKSVLSLLVGCAIDDGYLRSVDQPVTDLVPELARYGFDSVTLRHLLQMTSGIDYEENDFPLGIHVRFYYTDRLEEEILKLRLREPAGSRFLYKSGDAFLLTLALNRALGQKSVTRYMQERVWNPLGMEYEGAWSIDHTPGGLEKTGCCLAATARDFAKIGQLYLNKGAWNGRRIVPEAWVVESTRIDTSAGSSWDYQYMWWLISPDRSDFMAVGHLGQFLYVNPDAKIIVVRLGDGMGNLSLEEWKEVFLSLSDNVLSTRGE